MRRRVVITGMGVVSPNGIGKERFCRAVLDGVSGVRRISRFDASALPVQIAGEVVGFDELAWVEARERRHLSRCVPLMIAASTEALAYLDRCLDAGFRPGMGNVVPDRLFWAQPEGETDQLTPEEAQALQVLDMPAHDTKH